jgi:hypothetical protein
VSQPATMGSPLPFRGRLFRKYALLVVSLLGGMLAASSLVEMYFSYQGNKDTLLRIQKGEASAAAGKIEQFIAEVQRHVELIADSEWVRRWSGKRWTTSACSVRFPPSPT